MTNNYKFTITDADAAAQAIDWCMNNIKNHWDLDTHWPGSSYIFAFRYLDDAAKFVVHCLH